MAIASRRIGEGLAAPGGNVPGDDQGRERIERVVGGGPRGGRAWTISAGSPAASSSDRRSAIPAGLTAPLIFFGCTSGAPRMVRKASSGWVSKMRSRQPGSARSSASISRMRGKRWKPCFETLRGGADVASANPQAPA